MKPAKIRALLIEHQVKQTDIAKELGVTPAAVSRVIRGDYKSRRTQEAIATKVRVPFEKMWRTAA